jgi:hypothetical protein
MGGAAWLVNTRDTRHLHAPMMGMAQGHLVAKALHPSYAVAMTDREFEEINNIAARLAQACKLHGQSYQRGSRNMTVLNLQDS